MNTEAIRAALTELEGQGDKWEYEGQSNVHHVRVGPFKLSCKRGVMGINAEYTVRHDQAGVLRRSHPANSIHEAKEKAVGFALAWVNDTVEA